MAVILLSMTGISITRKRKPIIFILTNVLVTLVLGIGTGLGLGQRENVDANNVATRLSTTDRPMQYPIMNDMSIAAVALPNSSQSVYSQGTMGAIRQAVYSTGYPYSPLSSVHHIPSSDPRVSGANIKTSLAATTMFSNHRDVTVALGLHSL